MIVVFYFKSTQHHQLLPFYPTYSLRSTVGPNQGCLAHQTSEAEPSVTFSHLVSRVTFPRAGLLNHSADNQIHSPRMIKITFLRSCSQLQLPILPPVHSTRCSQLLVLTGYLVEPSLLSQFTLGMPILLLFKIGPATQGENPCMEIWLSAFFCMQ